MTLPTTPRILVDADACPVKDEIYRVAGRHEVPVTSSATAFLRVPDHPADRAGGGRATASTPPTTGSPSGPTRRAIVVTADILLADRCLKAGATVIAHNGKPFTASSIGSAIATRAIMADLRAGGDELAARRRSPRPTARASCRRWTKRWCG